MSRAGKLDRLKNSLHREYQALGKLRRQRARFLGLGAGPNYPHDTTDDGWYGWDKGAEDILPIMRKSAEYTAISLAANCPRVLVTSQYPDRLPFTRTYENAVNLFLKNMHAEEQFLAWALNGHYSLGIMKVYMADSVPVWIEESEWMDPGRPYLQNISPHHFVYDTMATQFEHCQFLADRYRMPFEAIVTDNRFSASLRKRLKELGPIHKADISSEEPWRRVAFDDSQLEDMIFLSDVFITKEKKVYTYVIDKEFNILIDEPLAVIDWDGQETGPYHFLNLGPVPDKTTPSSPAQNLELLANAANSLYRQLLKQAKMQRTVISVGSDVDDNEMTALRDAEDLSFIRTQVAIAQARIGGADQNNFAFFLNMLDQTNKYSGNVDMALGMAQTADTASQESMLAAGASRAEGYIQQIFVRAVRGVVKELGRLLFASNGTSYQMKRDIAPGIAPDDPWKAAVEEGSRMGEFQEYDLDIEPFSMAYKPPQQRVMELQQTFSELVPLAPLLMQQGVMPDVNYYIQEKARLLNNSCLEKLLVSIAPPEQQAGAGGHERTLGPTGPKEYVHRSVGSGGGGNPEQQQMAMMSAASADNAT
jgi:hypothetical protein